MKPSLYGVDIILTETDNPNPEPFDLGKVIEINGLNSGMSFYKTGQLEKYDAIASEIAKILDGKKLLFHFNPKFIPGTFDEEMINYHNSALNSIDEAFYQAVDYHLENNNTHNLKPLISNRFIERLDFKRTNIFGDDMRFHLLKAFANQNINFDIFLNYSANEEDLVYTSFSLKPALWDALLSGKEPINIPNDAFVFNRNYMKLNDLGLLWNNESTKKDILLNGRVFNEYFAQQITEDKGLTYFFEEVISELASVNLDSSTASTFSKFAQLIKNPKKLLGSDYFPELSNVSSFHPKSILYGPGIDLFGIELSDFLDGSDSDLFVVKPTSGSRGLGFRILTKEQLGAYKENQQNIFDEDFNKSIQKLKLDMELNLDFNDDMTLVQNFVKSKPIYNPDIQENCSACARAIVINGNYMGAMWRTNNNKTGNLDIDYRFNTSNGSDVFKVNEKDSNNLKIISEAYVKEFHKSISNIKTYFSIISKQLELENSDFINVQYLENFYINLIHRSLANYDSLMNNYFTSLNQTN